MKNRNRGELKIIKSTLVLLKYLKKHGTTCKKGKTYSIIIQDKTA